MKILRTHSIRGDEGLEDAVKLRRIHVLLILAVELRNLGEGRVGGVHVICQVLQLPTSVACEVPHLFREAVGDVTVMLVQLLSQTLVALPQFG